MTWIWHIGLGLLLGALGAGLSFAHMARRMRRDLQARVVSRVGPVLERRAMALGIPFGKAPELALGKDNELELQARDELERLLDLADAVDAQEASQLGFMDTLRVPREQVAEELAQVTGERRKQRRERS